MLLNLLASLLLLVINLLIFLKRILLTLFIFVIFKPLRLLFRFIFYKIIVRMYGWYFSVAKKIGWQRAKDNPLVFLIKQKFVHVLVVLS